MNSLYAAVPLMAFLVVLQTAVLPYFPILGFVPLLPFLVALAWGLVRGFNEGVAWAFTAGLLLDILSTAPIGVSSLAFMLAIAIVIMATQTIPGNPFFLPIIQSVVATFIFLAVQFLVLRLLGHQFVLEAILAILPTAFLHGVLILPIYWILNRLNDLVQPRRVKI